MEDIFNQAILYTPEGSTFLIPDRICDVVRNYPVCADYTIRKATTNIKNLEYEFVDGEFTVTNTNGGTITFYFFHVVEHTLNARDTQHYLESVFRSNQIKKIHLPELNQ